jgi:hypothetical protein
LKQRAVVVQGWGEVKGTAAFAALGIRAQVYVHMEDLLPALLPHVNADEITLEAHLLSYSVGREHELAQL